MQYKFHIILIVIMRHGAEYDLIDPLSLKNSILCLRPRNQSIEKIRLETLSTNEA